VNDPKGDIGGIFSLLFEIGFKFLKEGDLLFISELVQLNTFYALIEREIVFFESSAEFINQNILKSR
jgi:hypothetical protein